MKAILTGKNRELLWEDVPDPAVGPEDVLIKVEAAALNRADLMQRAGDYPPPPGCPEWLGLEIAGTVIKLGAIAEKNLVGEQGIRSVHCSAGAAMHNMSAHIMRCLCRFRKRAAWLKRRRFRKLLQRHI